MASTNPNDGFADGFNMNDSFNSRNSNYSYNNYDGYNGKDTYNTVTYASNSYDVNKRNYTSALIDNTEHAYWWDRLNAQQTKYGTTQATRPAVGAGTQLTAAQANALINGFSALKTATYSKDIDWSELNAIGTIAQGTSA